MKHARGIASLHCSAKLILKKVLLFLISILTKVFPIYYFPISNVKAGVFPTFIAPKSENLLKCFDLFKGSYLIIHFFVIIPLNHSRLTKFVLIEGYLILY
jgi:hypothetical protein